VGALLLLALPFFLFFGLLQYIGAFFCLGSCRLSLSPLSRSFLLCVISSTPFPWDEALRTACMAFTTGKLVELLFPSPPALILLFLRCRHLFRLPPFSPFPPRSCARSLFFSFPEKQENVLVSMITSTQFDAHPPRYFF